jgi:uncharacterized protein (DUF305 family)
MAPPEQTLNDEDAVHSNRRPSAGFIVLILALAFLGGAIGYFFGVRGSETPTSAVDVGFMADMSDHHDQAVQMAIMELAHGQDPTVLGFAQDVLLFQRSELGAMAVLLDDHGATRPEYDPERTAMAWMGMSTSLSEMPGLATEAEMAELDAARGRASDLLFLSLMSAHHEGGLHMAEFAAANASDPRVRALAERMAKYQAVEVREYEMAQERLGAPSGEKIETDSHETHSMPGMDH